MSSEAYTKNESAAGSGQLTSALWKTGDVAHRDGPDPAAADASRQRPASHAERSARLGVDVGLPRPSAANSPRTLREALPIFLAHASPRLLSLVVLGTAAARLWLGQWSAWDVAPVAAIVAYWPIQEWLIHVFILHFKPITVWGHTFDFRVPRKHRTHHSDPWNYEILFIPFHSFSYSLPLTLAVWIAVTPTTALALTGYAVHMLLALHYEWIHFLIHTRVTPRTRFYQQLWKNHRLHHFKNEHYWYGVTRLEGDWVLGTAPVASAVPLSPTARSLLAHAE